MKVRELATPQEFLSVTAAYLAEEPLRANHVASIAAGAAEGRQYSSAIWLVVTEGTSVVGAAVQAAPYSMSLGPMRVDAARALAREVVSLAKDYPGVMGPASAVRAFVEELGRPWNIAMRDNLRLLKAFEPPERVPEGCLRPVEARDFAVVDAWHRDFLVEAGLPVAAADSHSPRVRPGGGALWIWDVGGTPAAMAGHAPVVRLDTVTTGRIGPVYTVPAFRRQGIAAAATAGVVRALQPHCDQIMLFADADNATSNGVYERLGFVCVGEQVEVTLL